MKIFTAALLSIVVLGTTLSAKECALCERIRADNEVNHKNYEYYEDYQKDEQEEAAPAKEQKTTASTKAVAPKKP